MGWDSLIAIWRENEQDVRHPPPPVACEFDGEPLVSTHGVLFCQFCGRTFDR